MPGAILTVIIVNWNHGHFLKACLPTLLAQNGPKIDLIVVDNGSSDGSAEWVAQHYPQVRLLAFTENQGFARAINQAITQTASPFILSLNPDVTVYPNFISELLQAIGRDRHIGMAAPKLLCADDPARLDSTGLFIDRTRRPYDRGQGERDYGKYDSASWVFGPCGGAALYRRAMLNDVAWAGEYFDEDFFAYYEDVDLAWRAQGRGWRCIYVPTAVATHRRGSGDTLRRQKDRPRSQGPRLALCNRYLTVIKNDSLTHFLKDLPLILGSELPRLFFMAIFFPEALAGLTDLISKWPKAWRKRSQILERRTIDPKLIRQWLTDPEITAKAQDYRQH